MTKFLVVIVVLVALVAGILYSPIFEIKEVNFSGDESCPQEVKDTIKNQLLGKNLLLLNTKTHLQRFKDQFICIESLTVTKKLPTQLFFEIKAKVPVAKIAESANQVTKDGLIIVGSDNFQTPTIFLPKNIDSQLGKKIDDNIILAALEIAAGLAKSDFSATSIRIVEARDIAVYGEKDVLVIFSSEKQIVGQVDSLQFILGKAKIDAAKIAKIDLRFDKPIVTYK